MNFRASSSIIERILPISSLESSAASTTRPVILSEEFALRQQSKSAVEGPHTRLRHDEPSREFLPLGGSHSCILRANSPRGTETCSPVARFFSEKASAFTSFSPTIKVYFAPALVAASNDFFRRKLSSPKSATRSC